MGTESNTVFLDALITYQNTFCGLFNMKPLAVVMLQGQTQPMLLSQYSSRKWEERSKHTVNATWTWKRELLRILCCKSWWEKQIWYQKTKDEENKTPCFKTIGWKNRSGWSIPRDTSALAAGPVHNSRRELREWAMTAQKSEAGSCQAVLLAPQGQSKPHLLLWQG